jgi:uncharacterized membrane protein (DUF485 family)
MQSIVRRFVKDLSMDMEDLAKQLEAENRQSKAESDAFYDAYFTQMMLQDSFRSPWLWVAVASGVVTGALITAVVFQGVWPL